MTEYVFYTCDGYTIAPNGKELDSLQILGFEKGEDIADAKNRLIVNNPWIKETGFDVDVMEYRVVK